MQIFILHFNRKSQSTLAHHSIVTAVKSVASKLKKLNFEMCAGATNMTPHGQPVVLLRIRQ